jgi:hypothetical protein
LRQRDVEHVVDGVVVIAARQFPGPDKVASVVGNANRKTWE